MFGMELFERVCIAFILLGASIGLSCIVYVMWSVAEIPLLMAIIVSLIVVPCIAMILKTIIDLTINY